MIGTVPHLFLAAVACIIVACSAHGASAAPISALLNTNVPMPGGVQGLDPRDTAATHAALLALCPSMVRIGIHWDDNPPFTPPIDVVHSGWAFTDQQFALNAGKQIIALIEVSSPAEIPKAYPAVVNRYGPRIYALDVTGESCDAVTFLAQFTMVTNALASLVVPLAGPSFCNTWMPREYEKLLASGVLGKLTYLAAHEYYGCEGNGLLSFTGTWLSPDRDDPQGSCPKFMARLAMLKHYAGYTKSRQLIIEEFCLNPKDAAGSAQYGAILATEHVPAILNAPAAPIGAAPWSNWDTNRNNWSSALIGYQNARWLLRQ
jgi:hypothetical protein